MLNYLPDEILDKAGITRPDKSGGQIALVLVIGLLIGFSPLIGYIASLVMWSN